MVRAIREHEHAQRVGEGAVGARAARPPAIARTTDASVDASRPPTAHGRAPLRESDRLQMHPAPRPGARMASMKASMKATMTRDGSSLGVGFGGVPRGRLLEQQRARWRQRRSGRPRRRRKRGNPRDDGRRRGSGDERRRERRRGHGDRGRRRSGRRPRTAAATLEPPEPAVAPEPTPARAVVVAPRGAGGACSPGTVLCEDFETLRGAHGSRRGLDDDRRPPATSPSTRPKASRIAPKSLHVKAAAAERPVGRSSRGRGAPLFPRRGQRLFTGAS